MKSTLITIFFLLFFNTEISEKIDSIESEEVNSFFEEKLELTLENVYHMIIEHKIHHPKIVFSQVILETGHLKSGGARIHNNLFGFTTHNGHMKFETWVESVEYYKKWQEKRYVEKKYDDYYDFLTQINYAEDTLYIQKLKSINKRLDI